MNKSTTRWDRCPHCRTGLKIVCVKFRFRGVESVATCSNCAMAFVDDLRRVKPKVMIVPERVRKYWRYLWKTGMLDALNSRFRRLIVFLMVAVAVAALLRHVVHVYGGIAPADIRTVALTAITVVSLALLLPAKEHSH